MSEKTTLLPSAPADFVGQDGQAPQPSAAVPQHATVPMPRLVIVPGLEFDPQRKSRYGMHALGAAILIFISLILIELRDCNWSPGIDLGTLQALHISMMVFAFVLYLLSLFGIADFIFKYKIMFLVGIFTIYVFAGLMAWMTYEAATNPCVKTGPAPIDLSGFDPNKNVFTRGDGVGIIVLILDVMATVLTVSAAIAFYKRY